jgi:hypothetical protein
MTFQNPSPCDIPQMTKKHPLCDFRDTLPQFVRPYRPVQQSPKDGALPSSVDELSAASMGHGEISFFETPIRFSD